jgi:hypothetical protein
MVIAASSETAGATQRSRRLSRFAGVEGYLALVIMLDFVFEMFFGPLLPQFGSPYDPAIVTTLWACGWLFAISGVRHGRGGARVAARLSLAFFVLQAGLIVIVTQLFPRH